MNKKIAIHGGAFVTALILFWGGVTLFSPPIVSFYQKRVSLQKEYDEQVFPLKSSLQSGKIVLFGSSELSKPMTFRADTYLSSHGFPLQISGTAYHQSFSIYSKLVSLTSLEVRKNARVVVFLSPRWFTRDKEGMKTQYFLEDMSLAMMFELYLRSDADSTEKRAVSSYVEQHKREIKPLTFVYKYALNYGKSTSYYTPLDKIVRSVFRTTQLPKDSLVPTINYSCRSFNFDSLLGIAQDIEKTLGSNPYHVHDTFYEERRHTLNRNQQLPLSLPSPFPLSENQEYQDFLQLVALLRTFDRPPLFVLLGLNAYTYDTSRQEFIRPLYDSITEVLDSAHFGVVDMWARDTTQFLQGSYIDDNHPGEAYWVKVDSALVDYFACKELP